MWYSTMLVYAWFAALLGIRWKNRNVMNYKRPLACVYVIRSGHALIDAIESRAS